MKFWINASSFCNAHLGRLMQSWSWQPWTFTTTQTLSGPILLMEDFLELIGTVVSPIIYLFTHVFVTCQAGGCLGSPPTVSLSILLVTDGVLDVDIHMRPVGCQRLKDLRKNSLGCWPQWLIQTGDLGERWERRKEPLGRMKGSFQIAAHPGHDFVSFILLGILVLLVMTPWFWEITCFDPNFSAPTVLRMELLKEEAAGITRVKSCESPMAAAHEERACEMPKNSSETDLKHMCHETWWRKANHEPICWEYWHTVLRHIYTRNWFGNHSYWSKTSTKPVIFWLGYASKKIHSKCGWISWTDPHVIRSSTMFNWSF